MKSKAPGILACAGFAALLLVSAPALAVVAVAPPLGTAKQFGALGNSGVTGSTGAGVVVVGGDVGSSPTPTIINFPPSRTVPPFTVHYANDGVVQQAHADAITAYTALQSQGAGTVLADNLATVGALGPGVYSFTSGAPDLPASATLTFNDPTGTGIFVFNIGFSLTANVGSNVVGTANPCNIYWRVGTSATLNGTTFRGIVIADASITLGSGANLTGQVLAGTGATGAVTMAGSGGNTISVCTASPASPCPTITIAPTTLPIGKIGVAYSQQLTASGGTGSYTFSVVSGTLPAGVTLSSGGLLAGTPTTVGSPPVTILATDGNGCPGDILFVIAGAGASIPTLSGWGLMSLMVLIGIASIYRLRRI